VTLHIADKINIYVNMYVQLVTLYAGLTDMYHEIRA